MNRIQILRLVTLSESAGELISYLRRIALLGFSITLAGCLETAGPLAITGPKPASDVGLAGHAEGLAEKLKDRNRWASIKSDFEAQQKAIESMFDFDPRKAGRLKALNGIEQELSSQLAIHWKDFPKNEVPGFFDVYPLSIDVDARRRMVDQWIEAAAVNSNITVSDVGAFLSSYSFYLDKQSQSVRALIDSVLARRAEEITRAEKVGIEGYAKAYAELAALIGLKPIDQYKFVMVIDPEWSAPRRQSLSTRFESILQGISANQKSSVTRPKPEGQPIPKELLATPTVFVVLKPVTARQVSERREVTKATYVSNMAEQENPRRAELEAEILALNRELEASRASERSLSEQSQQLARQGSALSLLGAASVFSQRSSSNAIIEDINRKKKQLRDTGSTVSQLTFSQYDRLESARKFEAVIETDFYLIDLQLRRYKNFEMRDLKSFEVRLARQQNSRDTSPLPYEDELPSIVTNVLNDLSRAPSDPVGAPDFLSKLKEAKWRELKSNDFSFLK